MARSMDCRGHEGWFPSSFPRILWWSNNICNLRTSPYFLKRKRIEAITPNADSITWYGINILVISIINLWHLSKLHMVDDIPYIEPLSSLYLGCVIGKHHLELSPKHKTRWFFQCDAINHSVALFICGLVALSSIGWAKYLLTFIDDFSCFLWLCIIKYKYADFGKFC